MTEYLLSVWHEDGPTYGEFGSYENEAAMQAAFAETGKFNDEIVASGHFVFGGGLHDLTSATVVDNTTGGDVITTDGPFAESKEFMGGFWVIKAKDLDEALAIAARGSKACGGKVEVRPFQGTVD